MKCTFDWKEYAKVARATVAEGCVLLRNEDNALPIREGEKVSVFGRSQFNYFKSGTGSGGMVNAPYEVSIPDALKEENISLNTSLMQQYEEWIEEHPFDKGTGWANEPWCQQEMELTEEQVSLAAADSDIALVVLGRTAGEDKDNFAGEGSYFLTEEEENMLRLVCATFARVAVVLNVGNIIDMGFVQKYSPQAVMYVWQGGIEGGHGVADVLMGRQSPSGHLSDTIAYDIKDYPSTINFGNADKNFYQEDIYVGYRYFETVAKDRVMYPFGYGLSYTTFSQEIIKAGWQDDIVTLTVKVKNTGEVAGKEVVQVYYEPPQGKLCKPVRNLIRFAKTEELQPQEEQCLSFSFSVTEMTSFDDSGVTGYCNSYVLEAGEYIVYAGQNVREAEVAVTFTLPQMRVVEQLEEACAPVEAFERNVYAILPDGSVEKRMEAVPLKRTDMKKRIADNRPYALEYTGDKGYLFKDVMSGKVTKEEFLAQLSDEDLICMARGEGMCSGKVTPGIAGSFGGVTSSLEKFGIPIGGCADGPSGIRMDCGTAAFLNPNGTLLACTFNVDLVEELYQWEGMELLYNKIDTLLGPGMNIHRNPLNGRNFEYFSEDPYMTGIMASAMLKGLGRYGVTGTIKHYAGNNQESNRHEVDTIVSQRALREIYLKGFEIAVKEGNAFSVMTSYNPLNGIWTAGNYDLVTTILRKEWGFDGFVMTDWWAKMNDDIGDIPHLSKLSSMICAQNDVYMVVSDSATNPHKDDAQESLTEGRITRGELVRNASNILSALMRLPAGKRILGESAEFEVRNVPKTKVREKNIMPLTEIIDEGYLDLTGLKTEAGSINQFAVRMPNKGIYTLNFKMKSDLGELSQSSMTVFSNNIPVKTVTINGTAGEWIERTVDVEAFVSIDCYVDLAFAQSGIQIGEIKCTYKSKIEKAHMGFE